MLKQAALTSALAVALAVPAFAQTTTTPAPAARPAAPAVTSSTATQIDANKLIGQSIQNQADDKTVGKIDSVMLDSGGKVQKVVVGVGGFLGIGKKDVAIDWSQLRVMDNGKKVVMNADKDQLKAMPEFVWPKDHKRGSVWTASDTDRRPATTSGSSGTTTGTGMGTTTAPADTATPRTQR